MANLLVDPQVLSNFLNAATPVLVALGIYLNQLNAARGRARGEAADKVQQEAVIEAKAATTIAASNALALAEHGKAVVDKLDNITEQTNGINHRLNDTVNKQQIVIDHLQQEAKGEKE
jgi:hypothetical protein